ncbi:MAG: hypothetical protein ACYDGL_00610 [Bellilinea sp.]
MSYSTPMRKRWLIAAALLMLLFISACQPGQPTNTPPSFVPSVGVTVIVPTTQPATETPSPEATTGVVEPQTGERTPVIETPAPTANPVAIAPTTGPVLVSTPTTGSFLLPRAAATAKPRAAAMKITHPGPYSKVSSPIELDALISPGDDRRVYVNLFGEDGRIIVSQILDFGTYDSKRFNISPNIPFQINSAAELARLEIYVIDQFGQKIQLISVDLILIQYGDSDETANDIELEPYLVTSPREGTLTNGGVLVVEGTARPVADSPLIVELINEKGVVVGSGETQVSPPSEGSSHMPFQVIVPYTVDGRTRVRMTVRQESTTRIPGTVWLSSTVIFLDP